MLWLQEAREGDMPLYEFRCPRCGETFEELVRNLEQADEVVCPECGEKDVERLQSGFATVASGAGTTPGSSCSPRGGFS
jgi:putative FmdB family regulatory protein